MSLPQSMLNKDIYAKELYCLQQVSKTFRYLFIGSHKKLFWIDNKAVIAAQKSRAPSIRCLLDNIKSQFSNSKIQYVQSVKNASDIFTRKTKPESQNSNISSRTRAKNIPESKTVPEASKTRSPESTLRESKANLEPVISTENPKITAKIPDSLRNKIIKIHANAGCIPARRIHSSLKQIGNVDLTIDEINEIIKESCPECKNVRNHVKPCKSAPGITIPNEKTCQDALFIDHKK